MLWQLVCVSVLATGTALTAAVPHSYPPYSETASSALLVPAEVIPSSGSPTFVPQDHVRRAQNTRKKTSTSTVNFSSTAPAATSTTSPTITASPTTTTSSTSTSAATTTAAYGSNPKADCSCGYFMSDHNNAYYPLAILVDFATITSLDELPALGLAVGTSRIGGVNADDHTTACYSDPGNVRIGGGVMELVVPGGQAMGGVVTGAEVTSIPKMISGHLSMTAQLSAVHGTCQALFTYIDEAGFPTAGDEQDMEALGQSLDQGIVLTNWNPATYHTESVGAVIPFPSPPTTAFHNYTIFWPPADAVPRQTSYLFDGQLLRTSEKFVSVNPSRAYMNHWSNGQASFTQGPPLTDAVLRVSGVAWYYSTEEVPGLPAGCTMEQACMV